MTTHAYAPRGSALHLFYAQEPEVVLSGSAGTGKSRACIEKLHAACLRYPGLRCLMVRKTNVSLTNTGAITYREIVAKEAIESGEVSFHSGSREKPAGYMYSNGSTIAVTGLDKASRIMSMELDMIFVQEATELAEDDWEALTTRLRNGRMPCMQLIADCNPDRPDHWLKKRCDKGVTRMIPCRHEDNPRFYDGKAWTPEGAAYIRRLDQLTGPRRERLRYGRWTSAEGLVYDSFDPAVHISDRFNFTSKPPQNWPRYLSVDFGMIHPFVCQWWTQDPEGRLYLYRELHVTDTIVEDIAAMIRKLSKPLGNQEPPPEFIVTDHDAEGRATLERHLGQQTVAANKNITDGIQAVQERLRLRPDGKPGLYLCRDALAARDENLTQSGRPCSTIEEMTGYVWAKTGAAADKDHPVKDNDDGMDAMRYLVAQLDIRNSARVRFLTW